MAPNWSAPNTQIRGFMVALLLKLDRADRVIQYRLCLLCAELLDFSGKRWVPRARIWQANSPALNAPAVPMARVPTATPLGICTME